MSKKTNKKIICLLFFCLTLVSFSPDEAAAQNISQKDFTNLGLISISRNYTLAKDASHIIFPIRNNTTRTISNIFGWVYRFNQPPEGKPFNFVLVNNPHRGGTVIKGKPHRPTTIADWRFPLIKAVPGSKKAGKYTLRISTKSVFYPKVEPPNLKKKSPNQP